MADGRTRERTEPGALEGLRERLLRIAPSEGDYASGIPALTIHRRDEPTAPVPCIYDLGMAITIAGSKHVAMGDVHFTCEPGDYLLVSVDLPLVSHVARGSARDPYLGMMLRLDPRLIPQVASELTLATPARRPGPGALSQSSLSGGMLESVHRLVALVDEPELLRAVAPLVLQEIVARLLLSDSGPTFLQLNASGSPGRQVGQVIAWLKGHFAEAIRIDSLAEDANMSPSSFRQHFKSVTGLSPLQYVKHLRLQEARELMLMGNVNVSTAGLQVGYESLSQFSREYTRMFGEPPGRDTKRSRDHHEAE